MSFLGRFGVYHTPPLPSLESHATATSVINTGSDSLLCHVLTKTLPKAFLQRVLGISLFASKSGLRLYYYLCNTSPHDRSQRLLSLRKTLYAQVGCKDNFIDKTGECLTCKCGIRCACTWRFGRMEVRTSSTTFSSSRLSKP